MTRTEQVIVHETDPLESESRHAHGEDVASSIDASRIAGTSIEASPSRQALGIAESRRYRKRAQVAEKTIDELKSTLAEREKTISSQQETIAALEQREQIDRLLRQSDAVDLDTAALLTEIAVAQMDQPDVEIAVRDLKRAKPFLFKSAAMARRGTLGGGVSSARGAHDESPQTVAIDHAAEQACATGKRGDLLRYLRLKRGR